MRVLFLNGPPRSGKDTLASLVAARYPRTIVHVKLAGYLKEMASKLFPYKFDDYLWMEKYKDQRLEGLHNRTPREVLIQLSEYFYKPLFTADFFGRMLLSRLNSLQQLDFTAAVVSDSGFDDEIKPIYRSSAVTDARVVRLYRESCSFYDDSRNYLKRDEHPHRIDIIDYHNTDMSRLVEFAQQQAEWLVCANESVDHLGD